MNDQIRRQLTAFVDGELTPAERDAVSDLVRQNPEARKLLRDLERDAARLLSLPRVKPARDLVQPVMSAIKSPGIKRYPVRTNAWSLRHVAVAAAVLIGIGVTTFLILQDMFHANGPNRPLAGTQPSTPDVIVRDKVAPNAPSVASKGTPDSAASRPDHTASLEDLNRFVGAWKGLVEPVGKALGGFAKISPPAEVARLMDLPPDAGTTPSDLLFTSPPPVLTSPVNDNKQKFKTLDLKLPLFLDMKSLETPKLQERVKEEKVLHFDLTCVESYKGLERLQAACRTAGIKLIVDAQASFYAGKKVPAMYMLYVENASTDQVVKLVQALESEDQKAEKRPKGERQFDSLMVQPLDDVGRKKLADSLGVPVTSFSTIQMSPGSKTTPPGIDPTKPLSEDTRKALEKLAAGQGGKAKEPTGVVLVYYQNRGRIPVSKEVKAFYDSRKGWLPDANHIVLTLRATKG